MRCRWDWHPPLSRSLGSARSPVANGMLSFAMAVLAWNAYAVVQATRRSAHGAQRIDDELSDEHLVRDVVLTQTGLDIAVDPTEWEHDHHLPVAQFAKPSNASPNKSTSIATPHTQKTRPQETPPQTNQRTNQPPRLHRQTPRPEASQRATQTKTLKGVGACSLRNAPASNGGTTRRNDTAEQRCRRACSEDSSEASPQTWFPIGEPLSER